MIDWLIRRRTKFEIVRDDDGKPLFVVTTRALSKRCAARLREQFPKVADDPSVTELWV